MERTQHVYNSSGKERDNVERENLAQRVERLKRKIVLNMSRQKTTISIEIQPAAFIFMARIEDCRAPTKWLIDFPFFIIFVIVSVVVVIIGEW